MYYITTVDLSVKFLDFWNENFDVLKEEFPALEVTAFTTPVWDNKKQYDITESRAWSDWYESHKDWVHIAMHGFHHIKPKSATSKIQFEGLQSFENQLDLYGKSYDKLKDYMPKHWGFKSPFYKWNQDTLDALAELNCTWAQTEGNMHFFKKHDINWLGYIIETHCNNETAMSDRLDTIMPYLRWLLKNQLGNLNDMNIGKYGNMLKMYQICRHVNEQAYLNPAYYIDNEERWFNERIQLKR